MKKGKYLTYADLDSKGYQRKVDFCNKERMYFGKELTVCEFLACLEDINYHTESGRDYFEQFNNIYFDKAKEFNFDIDEKISFNKL
jgi:hypothetical protein